MMPRRKCKAREIKHTRKLDVDKLITGAVELDLKKVEKESISPGVLKACAEWREPCSQTT